MMQVSFDLISDLHIESWAQQFDWEGMPTSTICVVAGDIAKDKNIILDCLKNLANCYNVVLYIDGNEEYKKHSLDEVDENLFKHIKQIENVIYLKETVAVIDGVAFIGCNGWWTYDFEEPECYDATKKWVRDRTSMNQSVLDEVEDLALIDAKYFHLTIDKLQTHKDIKQIVLVSHTVPSPILIEHDLDLHGSHLLNASGNSHLMSALQKDTEGKVHTWCFGHYHGGKVDQFLEGVRFVNNPRGRGDTKWCQTIYNPIRITVDVN